MMVVGSLFRKLRISIVIFGEVFHGLRPSFRRSIVGTMMILSLPMVVRKMICNWIPQCFPIGHSVHPNQT